MAVSGSLVRISKYLKWGRRKEDLEKVLSTFDDVDSILWMMELLTKRVEQLSRHASNASVSHLSQAQELDARAVALTQSIAQTEVELKEGKDFAESIAHSINSQVENMNQRMAERLNHMFTYLDERMQNARRVLNFIDSIARQSHMISFNATIEAARAGQHGEGFSIIAEKIRHISQKTADGSKETAQYLDLDEFRKYVNSFKGESSGHVMEAMSAIKASLEELASVFVELDKKIQMVKENNEVIFEFLKNQDAANHVLKKCEWTHHICNEATALLNDYKQHHNREELQHKFEAFMERQSYVYNVQFDLLEDVLKRGVLRVAIEPSFKGLSFRLRPNDPLMGLDVEYAKAFARWLGVETQFVEYPWDRCTEVLEVGQRLGAPRADVMWSALPPSASYQGVAFSESYTYLEYVLARRAGESVNSLVDLQGKVLGCIKDPAAFATLEAAGFRWGANSDKPGGRIKLANLIAYTDQSRIHDCLAQGKVDAFAVDKPIYFWACESADSPWHKKIEIFTGNLAPAPWHYAAAVLADPSSYSLLKKMNEFITWFKHQPERHQIEKKWQGRIIDSSISYRDEPGKILGADDIRPQSSNMKIHN